MHVMYVESLARAGQFPPGPPTALSAIPLYPTIAVSDAFLSTMSFVSALLATSALEAIGYAGLGCAGQAELTFGVLRRRAPSA